MRGVLAAIACGTVLALLASPPSTSVARFAVRDSAEGGLILRASEGERRVRRPVPSPTMGVGAPFIIKVDDKNGGSSDFFMGYEEITPGRAIPRHYHPHVDEILFVHRGSGIATLGAREATVSEGATIYIPAHTSVSLRNPGPAPLAIVFLFAHPEMGLYFRDTSVPEGQRAEPFTNEELAAVRARHRDHITFEQP